MSDAFVRLNSAPGPAVYVASGTTVEIAHVSYTIVSQSEPRHVEVVPTVIDALVVARQMAHEDEARITILSDSGWILTLDELESLVEN